MSTSRASKVSAIGLAALLTAALAIGTVTPALASEMTFTDCPTTVVVDDAGNFSFTCTITNQGRYPGGVDIEFVGVHNVSGLTATPDTFQLDPGEHATFTVRGHLDHGTFGEFKIKDIYSNDKGKLDHNKHAVTVRR